MKTFGTLVRSADEHGNRLVTAGFALEALADLLGRDGSEHHLNDSHLYGLACAVSAIGAQVCAAGFDLCSQAEAEVSK